MKADEIYDAIIKSVPDVKIYETPIGTIVDAKKFNAFTERLSLEEQIWNRCNPNKELANEVYALFEKYSLTNGEADPSYGLPLR